MDATAIRIQPDRVCTTGARAVPGMGRSMWLILGIYVNGAAGMGATVIKTRLDQGSMIGVPVAPVQATPVSFRFLGLRKKCSDFEPFSPVSSYREKKELS